MQNVLNVLAVSVGDRSGQFQMDPALLSEEVLESAEVSVGGRYCQRYKNGEQQ